jgi:hypothetical protein
MHCIVRYFIYDLLLDWVNIYLHLVTANKILIKLIKNNAQL